MRWGTFPALLLLTVVLQTFSGCDSADPAADAVPPWPAGQPVASQQPGSQPPNGQPSASPNAANAQQRPSPSRVPGRGGRDVAPNAVATEQSAVEAPSLGGATVPSGNGAVADSSKGAAPRRKQYTWSEIEDLLAKLRMEGKDDFNARNELWRWYDELAKPEFTQTDGFAQHLERIAEWRDEQPESPTPLVVMAGAYIHFAWEARGNGVASTVTEEGWQLFGERIQKAHELLDKAIAMGLFDAQAYRDLLIVAKAEGVPVEQAREWLTEGGKLNPPCLPMYAAMGSYLLTKWHGEPGDAGRFAKEVPELVEGDDGLEALARVIMETNCSDRSILWWGGIDPKHLSGAARVLLDRYPNVEAATTYAGLLAWAAHDVKLARRAHEKMTFPYDKMAWGGNFRFHNFEQWCAAEQPAGESRRIWGSLEMVQGIAFSTNPRYVWVSTTDFLSPVMLVDTQSGEAIVRLLAPRVMTGAIGFNSNNTLLAVPARAEGFRGAVIWNVQEPERPVPIPMRGVSMVTEVSPVSPLVAVHEGNQVHLIDFENLAVNHTLSLADSRVSGIVFSPDGKLVAIHARQDVSVWDVETGEKKYTLPSEDARPTPEIGIERLLVFDNENRLIGTVAGEKQFHSIFRYSADGKEHEDLLQGDWNDYTTMSPNGRLIAHVKQFPGKGEPQPIEVWSVRSKSLLQTLPGHALRTTVVKFSADGKWLATGSSEGEVKIWELKQPQSEEGKE